MPYLVGFAMAVGFLLLGASSAFWWYRCRMDKDTEAQPDSPVPSPPPPPAPHRTADVHLGGDTQPPSMNRRLGAGLITVTTFGPSETVDTELW